MLKILFLQIFCKYFANGFAIFLCLFLVEKEM